PTLSCIDLEQLGAGPGGARQLLWWGSRLWVECASRVVRYDPTRSEAEVLTVPGAGGGDPLPRRFVTAGRLWGPSGVYEPRTGEFRSLRWRGEAYGLFGGAGQVWAEAQAESGGTRIARVDPDRLALRTVPLLGTPWEWGTDIEGQIRVALADNTG